MMRNYKLFLGILWPLLSSWTVLPLVALAQVEVPYTALQWINPEGDAATLSGVYSGIDNQSGYFRLLGDSTLIVTEGVRTVENGETWFRVYHNAYDFNLQQKNVVYSGKSPLYTTNTSGMDFKSTQNYLLDINGYCIGDQSNCDWDSSLLMSKVYDSNLDLLDVDSIAFDVELNTSLYYNRDLFISGETFPKGFPPILQPIVWFNDNGQNLGHIDKSEFIALSPNSYLLGYDNLGFYFLSVESVGSTSVYKFELHQAGQLQQSYVLDTLTTGVIASIVFIQNSDGSYLLNYNNAGKYLIVKLNSNFERIWNYEMDVPQFAHTRRNVFKTFENSNLVCFVIATTQGIRLIKIELDSGSLISDDVVYDFSLTQVPHQIRPIPDSFEVWYYDTYSEAVQSDSSSASTSFNLYRINQLEQNISIFKLPLPAISVNRYWKIDSPIIIDDTVFVYGYCRRESLTDFEEVPQPYFLAQYHLPQTSSLSNTPVSTALQLAPNPAQHQISLSHLPSEALEVRVVDLQGRVVYTQRSNRQNTLDIPIAQLSKGMYWVTVQGANGVKTQKFIKH